MLAALGAHVRCRWSCARSPGTRSCAPRCPGRRVRRRDALQGTSIGVLMSATLPARLGEPARALVVARRVGRPRESFPVVLGTLVSQTLLNLVALAVLGVVMLSTVAAVRRPPRRAVRGHDRCRVVLLVAVLSLPALLRSGLPARSERVARWLREARAGADAGAQRARRLPLAARSARRRRSRSSGRGCCSGSPATCCWSRSDSTTAPASAPPRRSCSPST